MSALELKIPPVPVAVLAGAMMAGIDWLWPQARFAVPHGAAAAVVLAVAGAVVAGLGMAAFWRARTTVNPFKPGDASSLVTGGVYRLSRNPMYLGLLLLLTGWAVYLANAAVWVGPVGFILYMNRFQIIPEERTLERNFGEAYRTYRSKVRRWI